jgi:tRNA-2-methylthio-N6-dimethylallyladenosine synthase
VCVPLQSGSQKILDQMKRFYKPDDVLKILKKIKKNNPNICLRSNYIAGFPGETWKDVFQSIFTLGAYDAIYTLKYSPRPFTPAAAYPNQLSERSKMRRTHLMNFLSHIRHFYVAFKSILSLKKI